MPDSIFSRTLVLVFATALTVALLNVGIIVFRPPPNDAPVTAHEIARLINGRPIAKLETSFARTRSASPPAELGTGRDLVATSVARYLGVPADQVRIDRSRKDPRMLAGAETQMEREYRLYAEEGEFNPIVFGGFTVSARLPDGQWTTVTRTRRGPLANWQLSTIVRILLTVVILAPFAWLFSKRLARPIRAFAGAAERLGRRQEVEPLEVEGPAEIRQAALAMNDMQTRLQRYVAERTSVVGAIAHDLRTPLSRLNFHLAAAPDPIRVKAEAEIAEMEQMITATLDFVQNEAKPRVHEPLDLALLVEGVIDDLADLGRDVALVRSAAATVNGDPILLKRLFANLINNAVTYGRRAIVTLDIDGGWAIVEVADEGSGLGSEDLARAFEPFYRAEGSRNRGTGGMGLGLAIVKTAADAHGGEVRLHNRAEGGLCARVSLPLAG
ncbi:ATP-binding protein [Sphingosinicella sp. BN140058]|uniref:sensor histidine kinase n=1 Tax=Sphingosinicella sp. BN140058 TaxID=1892855 RepID=UPI001010DF63|nr:ATP-binding protein [Sphingosinicella sp. BN140058]QAY78225.1 HAMP domain-containing protein [Sphingosinicella sp. BN140058]